MGPFRSTPCQLSVLIFVSSALLLLLSNSNSSPLKLFSKYIEPAIYGDEDRPNVQDNRDVNHVSESDNVKDTTCLPYIFYDKPVKTGSTSVRNALSRYLKSVSQPSIQCRNKSDCSRVAREICAGERPAGHLIQHVNLNASLTACLRNKQYYHATSIRDPKERIVSAYRYAVSNNLTSRIPYKTTLEEYLDFVPRCTLHHYYDHKGIKCSLEEAKERSEEIVTRFDEIMELNDNALSDLHQRIEPYLEPANVSPGGKTEKGHVEVPDETVEAEYLLYNKLQNKRKNLVAKPRRVLCEM